MTDEKVKRTDPKWTEYVLSLFEEDELWEGNPTTEGMRRVAQVVIGPVKKSVSKVVQVPNWNTGFISTVEHTLVFKTDDGDVEYGDVADTSPDNSNPEYAIFPSATSATKAEGRALRKALGLKHILAAEEKKDQIEQADRKITETQIHGIVNLCERNDIDVVKFYNSGISRYKTINEVPWNVAAIMFKTLNEIEKGRRAVDSKLVGFKKNWRKDEGKG